MLSSEKDSVTTDKERSLRDDCCIFSFLGFFPPLLFAPLEPDVFHFQKKAWIQESGM